MAAAEDVVARLPDADGVTYSALILNERGFDRALSAGGELTRSFVPLIFAGPL
ncbi:hypothetical protein VX037_20600 [Gordonia sp. Z-3]|jgi:hypothetical protein|uniref:hypothetical protein n=1 Tax=Gordonia sp. Z-3 TaxID=3115408 RepID=UPI002E28E6C3|nr:hypothetical protein [Gordonia sp. Z-3]MED5803430.1 hypothetical protein [Gordonia sp. Z-3]